MSDLIIWVKKQVSYRLNAYHLGALSCQVYMELISSLKKFIDDLILEPIVNCKANQIPTQSQPPAPMLITFTSQFASYSSGEKKAFQFSTVVVVVSRSLLLSRYNRGILCVSKASLLCSLSLAPFQHTRTHTHSE